MSHEIRPQEITPTSDFLVIALDLFHFKFMDTLLLKRHSITCQARITRLQGPRVLIGLDYLHNSAIFIRLKIDLKFGITVGLMQT